MSKGVKLFNGEDFDMWKFDIQSVLMEKQLLHTINQEVSMAIDLLAGGEKKDAEIAKRNKALGIIRLALHPDQKRKVMDIALPHLVLERLSKEYQAKTAMNKTFLRRLFYTLQWSDGHTLDQHLATFDAKLQQLGAVGVKIGDEEAVAVLLNSLPPQYETLITSLWGVE